MRWLWGNWELKLVSLVVAVALWTYTSGQVRVERTVQVEIRPEQIAGLPDDLRATAVVPAHFEVVLSVPTRKIDAIRDEVLRPALPLSRDLHRAGNVEVALTGRILGLDSDIRIDRTDPSDLRTIAIQLESIVLASVRTEAPPVVGLPPGLAAEVVLDQTQVDVRGPRAVIDAAEHQRMRFAPIRLEGIPADLAAPREERVEIQPLPGQPEMVQKVIARVLVKPDRTGELRLRVPVSVLLPAAELGRWSLAEAAPAADLVLHGPDSLLAKLAPADLPAWLDLRGQALAAGTVEAPVRVLPPAGVVAAPGVLKVTLQPRP